MKQNEAARLVSVLLAAYPSQCAKLDEKQQAQMVTVFADLLDELSYELCNAALRVLMQTAKFMPSVAEVRAAALELKHGAVAAGGEAWGSVVKAMQREGANKTPGVDFVFRDPVTARCVNAFGWRELCLSENAAADRARFIELYDVLASEHRREQQAPVLAAAREVRQVSGGARSAAELVAGIVETANRAGGLQRLLAKPSGGDS